MAEAAPDLLNIDPQPLAPSRLQDVEIVLSLNGQLPPLQPWEQVSAVAWYRFTEQHADAGLRPSQITGRTEKTFALAVQRLVYENVAISIKRKQTKGSVLPSEAVQEEIGYYCSLPEIASARPKSKDSVPIESRAIRRLRIVQALREHQAEYPEISVLNGIFQACRARNRRRGGHAEDFADSACLAVLAAYGQELQHKFGPATPATRRYTGRNGV
jgi:hypothetical protein